MRALLAVDIEEDLEDLEEDAGAWLRRLGATTDLVYVAPPVAVRSAEGELRTLLEAALERQDAAHRERLQQVLGRLVPPELRGEVRVLRDPGAAAAIVGAASGHDLLLVGTHARSGVARAWLGSVAERVVRTSPAPVLVLHRQGGEAPASSRLLVAVDLAEPEPLMREAARWAARLSMTVDALHVSPPLVPTGVDDLAWGPPLVEAQQETLLAASRLLVERVGTWPAEVRGRADVEPGDPADEVCRRASTGYAAVVLGTHGRQGMARLWMGSVAERVVRLSPVPVLVVPTRPSGPQGSA